MSGPVEFIGALFDPADWVEVRLIESWVAGGKKKSLVTREAVYRAADVPARLPWLLADAEQSRANIYYGVCPRPVGKIGYGRSGFVPTVRCLWADIDHASPYRATGRIREAGLPEPSIVVDSGHGTHAYWLLAEPLIVPPTYRLDKRDNPIVSDLGRAVESVVGGLASLVGGDRTQDLARLLRVPGTLNRKDERHGARPYPCRVWDWHPDRRYPWADLERLAPVPVAQVGAGTGLAAGGGPSAPVAARQGPTGALGGGGGACEQPESRPRATRICSPAPKPIQAPAVAHCGAGGFPWADLTARQRAALEASIERVATAPIGTRSEADFGLIAFAFKLGVCPDELWRRVEGVGKFAERGRGYFDSTWNKVSNRAADKRARLIELYGDCGW